MPQADQQNAVTPSKRPRSDSPSKKTTNSDSITSPHPRSQSPAKSPSKSPAKSSLTHANVVDGWFKETCAMWPGQMMTLKVNKILHTEKSKFQDVLVFESETYGNVLVLDGVIQCTERDEIAYQEMIAHTPLMLHPNPKNVLVIGGGDGGVLREVVKHSSVEHVTLCEIDEAVPRVSKLYLPKMAEGFKHPKVKVHIGDGFEFLKQKENTYDVIITDSSDPVGPAESLFQPSFFTLLSKALKPNGMICSQGECIWLHLDLITDVFKKLKGIFPSVSYAYTSMPTYPCGTIGFFVASKQADTKFTQPRKFSAEEEKKLFKFYNSFLHEAAFRLPTFVRNAIESVQN